MRSSTLLALFVCVVFVSSGFRTAFGQDEIQTEEGEKHVASKSDEGAGETPSESQDPSGNHQAASGDQEMLGKLQVDPDDQGQNELQESAEAGDGDANKQDVDVDIVSKEPETHHVPGPQRSGNLDTNYGKRSLYTVGVKTVYVAGVVVSVVTCEECDWVDGTKNLGNFSRQRK